jgi:methionyl-tRNA formyltransferase
MLEAFTKRVLFVGIPDMAYICLHKLNEAGVNIVGVVGAKKNHPTYFDFKNFVYQHHLNFIEYDELDDEQFIQTIKDLDADIAVICSFNYKVPQVLLNSVKGGFVNVHPSLLPKYRGSNPYSAVILNEEEETGVTLHFMDSGFDTGNIIAQRKIGISKFETMGTLFNRTNFIALDMLFEVLRKYEQAPLTSIKQSEGTFIKGNNLKEEFLKINYHDSAKKINSLIRALNPFVLARTFFRGTPMKILSADFISDALTENKTPGEIVKVENDKFYIVTGQGLLALTSMQFGSFFAGTSKEFIQILEPKIGEKFE